MDELTRYMQDKVSLCILFVDDIVLVAETKVEVNAKQIGRASCRERVCLYV